jgi:Phosphoglycerate dehydrogenase and related dehydrogenases
MKILIDKNIPYIEHFFADHIDQIEYFCDEDFEIENVTEDSVVIVRSTYKTHGKKIPKSIKFLCSASTGEDHIDKEKLDKMKIPYAFSTGANAIAVREYTFSA